MTPPPTRETTMAPTPRLSALTIDDSQALEGLMDMCCQEARSVSQRLLESKVYLARCSLIANCRYSRGGVCMSEFPSPTSRIGK